VHLPRRHPHLPSIHHLPREVAKYRGFVNVDIFDEAPHHIEGLFGGDKEGRRAVSPWIDFGAHTAAA
jgi:hypothetical protein